MGIGTAEDTARNLHPLLFKFINKSIKARVEFRDRYGYCERSAYEIKVYQLCVFKG